MLLGKIKIDKSGWNIFPEQTCGEIIGFYLNKSGRYSHSNAYIKHLCAVFNYQILHFSTGNLRKDKGQFLIGGFYVLEFQTNDEHKQVYTLTSPPSNAHPILYKSAVQPPYLKSVGIRIAAKYSANTLTSTRLPSIKFSRCPQRFNHPGPRAAAPSTLFTVFVSKESKSFD